MNNKAMFLSIVFLSLFACSQNSKEIKNDTYVSKINSSIFLHGVDYEKVIDVPVPIKISFVIKNIDEKLLLSLEDRKAHRIICFSSVDTIISSEYKIENSESRLVLSIEKGNFLSKFSNEETHKILKSIKLQIKNTLDNKIVDIRSNRILETRIIETSLGN